jgi:urea transporter
VTPASERLLSVAPSPAFWLAVFAYAGAAAALLIVLAGHNKLRPVALGLVGLAFVAHGIDIGWRACATGSRSAARR